MYERSGCPGHLFGHIFDEDPGFVVAFTGRQARLRRHDARHNELAAIRQRSFRHPDEADRASAYLLAESERERDAYVGVHLFRKPGRRLAANTVPTVRSLWLDEDEGVYPETGPEPTAVVASSASRRRLYWRLTREVSVAWAVAMNRRIASWAAGDIGKAGLATVLRVPGTMNYKRHPKVDPVAIQITEAGPWEPEVLEQAIPPIPEPSKVGSKTEPYDGPELELEEFLTRIDSAGERNWRLILAWLAQAFTPAGPYPILTLLGPQGAAKSTAQRILRNIVDASSVPLRTAPRDEHNLYIDARAGWVIALDNMSGLPQWLSDALCRLATGGGFSTRQLYTDQDQILFDAMRPVILNGIGDVITRPDLLDRALIINLPPIPKEARKLERVLDAEVEEAKPGILGAIFSAVSAGLATQEEVKLDGLPRMADFARWGTAAETALGGEAGSFMDAYEASQEEAVERTGIDYGDYSP